MEMFKYDSRQIVWAIKRLHLMREHSKEISDLLPRIEGSSIQTKDGMFIFFDRLGYLRFSSNGVTILSIAFGESKSSHPLANYVNQVFDKIMVYLEEEEFKLNQEKTVKIESEVSKFVGITL